MIESSAHLLKHASLPGPANLPACLPADQFPAEKRERYCRKAQKLVAQTLQATRFAGCPVVPVAARPGGCGAGLVGTLG
jgi:hypothetical protein